MCFARGTGYVMFNRVLFANIDVWSSTYPTLRPTVPCPVALINAARTTARLTRLHV